MSIQTQQNKRRKSMQQSSWWRALILQAWLPAVALVVIWFVSPKINSIYFPAARTVFDRTIEVWFPEALISDLLPSLSRLAIGFGLALLIGMFLGVILGLSRSAESAAFPLTETARAIPGIALLPIAMMFFGTGDSMKLLMIVFVSMWPIVLNTIEGVRSVDPNLHKVMSSFRIRPLDRLSKIYLPAAMPHIFSGVRISLAVAVGVMVAAEMFGTPGGIGYFIREAQQTFRIVDM